jgi:hypothetical protein
MHKCFDYYCQRWTIYLIYYIIASSFFIYPLWLSLFWLGFSSWCMNFGVFFCYDVFFCCIAMFDFSLAVMPLYIIFILLRTLSFVISFWMDLLCSSLFFSFCLYCSFNLFSFACPHVLVLHSQQLPPPHTFPTIKVSLKNLILFEGRIFFRKLIFHPHQKTSIFQKTFTCLENVCLPSCNH